MNKINLPKSVSYILDKLNENGYDAYIVGGCVRDYLLGLCPHDWDITTSATPSEIKKVFDHTIATGEKFGTITVSVHDITPHEYFEVTTFRSESTYSDGRRPDAVTFGKSVKEDLKRRDLTINALAYNEKEGLIDLFGGKNDIKNKIIRCVGNPDERIKEDALRILRAIRFMVKFNFDIEENTLTALKNNVELIANVSKERVRVELISILENKIEPQKYRKIKFIFNYLFKIKQLNRSENKDEIKFLIEKTIWSDLNYKVKLSRVLGLLYSDTNDIQFWLTSNRYSNEEVSTILNLIKLERDKKLKQDYSAHYMRILLSKYPYSDLELYFSSTNGKYSYNNLLENAKYPHSLKDLVIKGDDVLLCDISDKQKGECLKYLLEKVLLCPDFNNVSDLTTFIKEYKVINNL